MLFISILRRNQMAKVYRIETPPKKTNFHKPATMNASAPMEQGRVFSKPRENWLPAQFAMARKESRALTENFPPRFFGVMSDIPTATPSVKYKRIVLKLSGEVLRGKSSDPIDAGVLERVAPK
jgi:hypothetical protein